jgi:hypothetical protein
MPQHRPEVVDRITSLAVAGLTRSAIASQVGLTRSAVCGLLHRLGIFTPAPRKPPRLERTKRPYIRMAKPSKPEPRIISKEKSINSPGVAWCDLAGHHCRWPLDGARWCGKAKREGSYCSHHFALAYRPSIHRVAA